MRTIQYVNLTNGIEAIDERGLRPHEVRYLRIQSSWCEQKLWADVLAAVSDDFLMNVALGHTCLVHDYSQNSLSSRALWQGMQWIEYVLTKYWYGAEYEPKGRCESAAGYFKQQFHSLPDRTLTRLRYFRAFVVGKRPRIITVGGRTTRDGSPWYAHRLMELNGAGDPPGSAGHSPWRCQPPHRPLAEGDER